MQVVLARGLIEGPRRTAEVTDPVVWRPSVGRRISPDVVVPVRPVRVGLSRPEPSVLVAGVVRNHIDHDPHGPFVCLVKEAIQIGEGPEGRIHTTEVSYVIAPVGHRRRIEGRDPDEVDSQV